MELNRTAEDDLDRELNELIIRNQKKLAELHNDVKYKSTNNHNLYREVSKIVGEPVINVRKIKNNK